MKRNIEKSFCYFLQFYCVLCWYTKRITNYIESCEKCVILKQSLSLLLRVLSDLLHMFEFDKPNKVNKKGENKKKCEENVRR